MLLQTATICANIAIVDGWARCPDCGVKLLHVLPQTTVRNLPVYCRRCKTEKIMNIVGTEAESPAPEACRVFKT